MLYWGKDSALLLISSYHYYNSFKVNTNKYLTPSYNLWVDDFKISKQVMAESRTCEMIPVMLIDASIHMFKLT